MHYVYLLQSTSQKRKYIGCTSDLKKRLVPHNADKVASTRAYRPWRLAYYEAYVSKYDAYQREKDLKNNYTKKKELLARIRNSLSE